MTPHRSSRELRWLSRLLATALAVCAGVTVAAPASPDARSAPAGGVTTAWDAAALDRTAGAGFGAAPGDGASVRPGLESGSGEHHGAADALVRPAVAHLSVGRAPARSVATPYAGRTAGCTRSRAPPLA